MNNNHSDYHSQNAFCGSAGPEEMDHLSELLEDLTDDELKELVHKVGIEFTVDDKSKLDRDSYLGVVDEANREDFYREYKKIVEARKK